MKHIVKRNFITYPGGFGELVKGGKPLLSAHAKKFLIRIKEGKWKKITLTLLEELESIDDTGLITLEEKSAIMMRLSRFILVRRHLRSKLNPASHNSMGCDRKNWPPGRRNVKVVSRVGFPDVRSKWTTQRGGYLTLKWEVVVPVQQANLSVSPLGACKTMYMHTLLDHLLELGRLGMGKCQ